MPPIAQISNTEATYASCVSHHNTSGSSSNSTGRIAAAALIPRMRAIGSGAVPMRSGASSAAIVSQARLPASIEAITTSPGTSSHALRSPRKPMNISGIKYKICNSVCEMICGSRISSFHSLNSNTRTTPE